MLTILKSENYYTQKLPKSVGLTDYRIHSFVI